MYSNEQQKTISRSVITTMNSNRNLSLFLWMTEDGEVLTSPEDIRNISYEQVMEHNQDTSQRSVVFHYLHRHPDGKTMNDIERDLHMRISSVTARINELRKRGLVRMEGARVDEKTGKLNCVWVVN